MQKLTDTRSTVFSTKMQTHHFAWIGGFVILTVMTVVLYGFSMQQAWLSQPVSGAAVTVLMALLLFTLAKEARTFPEVEPTQLISRPALYNFAGVVGGGLLTYLVSVDLGLGAVVASGLVGLLGALIFPKQAVPIYCGSFVGMVSPALLDCYSRVLTASVIAGIVYVLSSGALNGFGGKLGTIAFTGTVLAGLGFRCEFVFAALPTTRLAWQIMLCAVGAAVATFWLSVDLKHGAVIGSSVVGLVGGLLLPILLPETGPLLAVVAICASFTGMSSTARVPNHLWMTLAGVVTGVIFIYSLPVLGGAGGKLGTIAFGAAMVAYAVRLLLGQIGLLSLESVKARHR